VRTGFDKIVEWKGWRALGALTVTLVIAVNLYVGFVVHEHNNVLNDQSGQISCMRHDFDQVLNELLNNAKITPPPNC
jgi:hypothetical protein